MTVCHVHDPYALHSLTTTMSPDEYDKLSPEEREIKDKEDRAREQREQAGIHDRIYRYDYRLSRASTSPPLQVEARAW